MKEIQNAQITKADLSMADHGVLTLQLVLKGQSWGCVYGGYALGYGYLNSKSFEGRPKGIEEIMRIMDVVGVEHFNELTGKYIRVETEGLSGTIKKIGNIIQDKWFDYDSFYKGEGQA